MKKNDDSEIEDSLRDFPENIVRLIKELIDEKDYSKKHNARIALVKMGKTIVPKMHKLLTSKNALLRMEAVKIVELIADRTSIPLLICMLSDTEFEVRWIAAEGLIKIGRRSILPLIISLRDGKSAYIFNKGAHHVLQCLLNEKEKKELSPLLRSLDDYLELGETAPIEASKAIDILGRNDKQVH